MLGNQVELWESMLAVTKLGAVIMPTTGALGPADLPDRIARGGARFVIANAGDAAEVRRRRTASSPRHRGRRRRRARAGTPTPTPTTSSRAARSTRETTVDDPLLIYFTSGTTSKPKLVEHTQVSYPVGHLSTMAWLGLRPGDVHLAISSPGWAKHAWSCFFAPWIAEATIFVYNYARFDAAALLEPDPPRGCHHVLRAADGVADADPGRPGRAARGAARGPRRRRAAQPRGHRAGASARGG